ncbi:MAG: type IV secretory system conjugative DNA transfer family protein [Vicinamibacterales bacterium]
MRAPYLRELVEHRTVINLALAAGIGLAGLQAWPFPADNAFLLAIQAEKPRLFSVLAMTYTMLWITTPLIAVSLISALAMIAVLRRDPTIAYSRLPEYPVAAARNELFLILGEQHHPTRPVRVTHPEWLTIPRRGLHTGMMILGAVGTGKTSACMYPYVDQLLGWRANKPAEKIGGLILEVKGDFCQQVREILTRHGREEDYVEVGLDSSYCYNPLHNDLEPYALAYSIATLLNNLYGRGKEPFWQQAYTDLVKFLILLRKVVDGYTTLAEIYHYAIDDSRVHADLERGKVMFGADGATIRIPGPAYQLILADSRWSHWAETDQKDFFFPYDPELEQFLGNQHIPFTIDRNGIGSRWADHRHQLDAVQRWHSGNWLRLETRLRSSIVEGIVVFLSLFDDNPNVARAFCPPKTAYFGSLKPAPNAKRPLPPLEQIFEAGKMLALNFPVGLNPGLAKALGVMLKLDFQRAVLARIPKMAAAPSKPWRDLLFVCDEYHSFATTGDTDPSGDERTFALSRQARLIPIVATQSISSLRSAIHGEESWRTLLQCFRTKIFLATSDEFTARAAADLCGKAECLRPSFQLSEAGQNARVSLFTGRAAAPKSTVTATKHYSFDVDFVFQPKVFAELKNCQAIVLPYDGLNPKPPTYCYLKPHYLDPQTSYFDHLAAGAL